MIQQVRMGLTFGLVMTLGIATTLADTWTDSSGQFSVEAEYVGVEGRSVVLRKADGSTIKVPISRLSDESRAKAKELFEAAKLGSTPTTPSETSSAPTSPAASPAADVGIPMPEPPAVKPLADFPADPSLQQTVDHVRDQLLAGHPEVIWYALPTSMRAELDSDEVRDAMKPMMEQQAQVSKPIEELLMKVLQVLVKQKQFVLNSPMLTAQVPPPMMESVRQAYDPVVGVLAEVVSMQFAMNNAADQTFTQMLDYHGPRIGGHLQGLMPMLPPGAVDQAFAQVQIAQTGPNSGTITVPGEDGPEVTEMVKFEDRWIPKDLADLWEEKKGSLAQEIQQAAAMANDPQAMAQANMMINMVVGTANGMIDPLLNASSQEEFDQAVMQLMGMAAMFGGGGPGGPPGAGGFGPGGPGGFGPGGPGGGPPGDFGPPPDFPDDF